MAEDLQNGEIRQVLDEVSGGAKLRYEAAGSVFEGSTTDEVIQKMLKSTEHANAALVEQKNRSANLEQQVQQLQQSRQPVVDQNAQKTTDQVYWEKWQQSPVAAQRYLDSQRLGVPEDQVDAVLRQNVIVGAATVQNQGGEEFMRRNPDFPQSVEASNALVAHMNQRYAGRGNPQSPSELADRLEISFNELVRQGRLQPADTPIEGVVNQRRPVPSLGGSGAPVDTAASFQQVDYRARTMPLDKLKEAIEQLSARGGRR